MSFFKKGFNVYRKNKIIFENFSFIALMEIFLMLVPLLTYPYLIRILGVELYGYVILAQVIASYFSIIVDFGFKRVSARHISIHRDNHEKLSEIMSTIFVVRFVLWVISFILYISLIFMVDSYRDHFWLFIFAFGFTFNELLFPQFFFQGIEKMKSITIINIIIRLVFVVLIFTFISNKEDYLYVPLFYSIGYFIGGIVSFYILIKKYKLFFVKPSFSQIRLYTNDSLPIFYSSIITTVKDKFSYIIIGQFIGVAEITIYDLGSKLVSLISKPSGVIGRVLFPRIAKTKDLKLFKRGLSISFGSTLLIVVFANVFLEEIVLFFMGVTIDLFPLRLFLLSPLFLSIGSFISSNLMISLGYNKYILYSIVITTVTYCFFLFLCYYYNYMSIQSMILVTVIAYFTEFLYRVIIAQKIIKKEKI